MINIESLPLPTVFEKLDYEEILNNCIQIYKDLLQQQGISWEPLESDQYMIQAEALAYRILGLFSDFNTKAKAFFLLTAEGDDLDNIAAFYGVERLQGAFPYAKYEFELSFALGQDLVIPKGLVLTDETSSYEGILLDDVLIPLGTTKANGTIELQQKISQSDVKTEIVTTPLPYVMSAKALEIFNNGSSTESDKDFRFRVLLSMADKSTAGSEETYTSFTYKADERIEDVKVKRALLDFMSYVPLLINKNESEVVAALEQIFSDMGTVNVYYYSDDADEIMQDRIVEKINAKEVRPLTDTVLVKQAEEISFSIDAEIKIFPNQESLTVLSNAKKSLEEGLITLKKIGTSITLSEINDFLRVQGVKEVVIKSPTKNIVISDSQIGINNANTINYSII